ncbi:Choline/Carnitine o-acyltransferase-domain-containing protein [Sordaria brevicollis]|uniref:Choline/Carnitine o-acyltransferase-domain-containing protein n=1 Tax=Sordaria brevicollis TaxID=83679 RepID=A0AAE0UAN4_SORBR|nr:Choline/Carnitine o-acyltransferase-domain-containing protein [Sordaria brevicollis]
MTLTEVRTFTPPRAFGDAISQTLVTPVITTSTTPRSVPDLHITLKPAISPSPKSGQFNMTPTTTPEEKPKGGVTFAHQDKLPKLPIPELESTCQRYLSSLKPLQTHREHAETRRAVQEFLQTDGPELHEKLKKYAEGQTSYIEQFWYDSYLNYDNPVVLNLNPFFLLEDDPTPARNNQVTRAASLIASALEFVRAVRREELPPDTVRGTPLDMYQYSRLFGTARVPTDSGCQIQQDDKTKHLVVMCHGQFYWFDVLDDNSDAIMTEKDIAINLQTIVDDARQIPIQEAAKSALGVLSTENRKVWSGLRDVLAKDPGSNNADCLSIVDSALFVVCLDYTEPTSSAALCQNMLCGTSEIEKGVQIGTCTNRWYDKLQIIVCKNGSAGINFEHTGVDGHTVLRFASDVYTDTILRFARSINGKAPSMWASTSPDPSKRDPESFGDVSTTPHKLEWDMGPELSVAVRFAETRLADLIEQNEFQCLDFNGYGKNFITSMGFSPDAFVQMAFQAAYYGLYGRVECTYEPAMTKMFLHGRTEAIRTVSDDSVNFVQTFWADAPGDAKIEALRKACQAHVNKTRDCAKAQGCDRHLYAMLCLWQRMQDDDNASTSSGSSMNGYSFEDSGSPSKSTDSVFSQSMDSTNGTGAGRDRGDSINSLTTPSQRGPPPLPAIFGDAGWDKLNTTILSTSNCGNPSLRHFGFGPVSGEGFGIGYIIKDECISICVSSRHRQTRRFVDTLESYLLEIRRILRIAARNNAAANAANGGNAACAGKGMTRAREIDAAADAAASSTQNGTDKPVRPKIGNRIKSRGRLVTQQSSGLGQNGPTSTYNGGSSVGNIKGTGGGSVSSAMEESVVMSEDDEIGGYGFFDAGMLQQALKARQQGRQHHHHHTHDSSSDDRSQQSRQRRSRRDVGKRLPLIDY